MRNTSAPIDQQPADDELETSEFEGPDPVAAELDSADGLYQPQLIDPLKLRVRSLLTEVSLRALAERVGVPAKSLTDWLDDTRPARKVGPAVSKWFAKLQLQSKGRSYVVTPSGVRVQTALEHSREHGEFVVIHGGPGVGKTITARRVASQHAGICMVTVDPTTSGLIPALELVAEELGVSEAVGGAKRLSALIRRRIEMSTEPVVLLVDEAQHLSMAAVEALRAIHDRCGCGLVLMGNETSYSRLVGGPRTAHYAQIRSRIGLKVRVAKPTDDDVRYVAAAWGVVDERALKVLREVAARPGALRTVSKLLLLCARKGEEITRETLLVTSRTYGAEV